MRNTNAQIADKLSDDLFKYIDDELSDKDIDHIKSIVGDDNGHSQKHSNDLSDVNILNRMLVEQKNINGKFTSKKHQWEAIRTILDWQAKNIIDNLDGLNNNQNIVYSIENIGSFDDKPLGEGFILVDGFYHKFESENASVILKKDTSCPYGFHLQTAFPGGNGDAEQQKSKLKILQDDCSSIMMQTDYYKNASPTEQAYLKYIANPKNKIQARYSLPASKNNYEETITLYKNNKDGTSYRAYITPSEIKVSKFDTNKKPMDFPMAQTRAHRSRLDLSSESSQIAFAKIEPEFTKTIKSISQNIKSNNSPNNTKLKSNRQLPDIVDTQSTIDYVYG